MQYIAEDSQSRANWSFVESDSYKRAPATVAKNGYRFIRAELSNGSGTILARDSYMAR